MIRLKEVFRSQCGTLKQREVLIKKETVLFVSEDTTLKNEILETFNSRHSIVKLVLDHFGSRKEILVFGSASALREEFGTGRASSVRQVLRG